MIIIYTMTFPEYLERKFVEWQQREGRRKTIADFATYLGVSQSVISMWMNGSRKPNQPSIELLADNFGLEIYDVLGMPRPDPDLHYLKQNWEHLSPETRRAIREQAEQYATDNQAKRTHPKRRTSQP